MTLSDTNGQSAPGMDAAVLADRARDLQAQAMARAARCAMIWLRNILTRGEVA
jgi:hypothetical protein